VVATESVAGHANRAEVEQFDPIQDDRSPASRAAQPPTQGLPRQVVTVYHRVHDTPPDEVLEAVEVVFGHGVA